MFDEKDFLKNSKNFFLLLACFSILLLFFNFWGVRRNIEESANFLIKPVQLFAFESSKSVKNFFGVFEEVRNLRGEYYELQEEYLKLKADKNFLSLLKEENLILKEQLDFDKENNNLILAEVLFQDWALRNESLLVNKGQEDGIGKGDVALIGKMYVGIVSEVYENTAKIRLPTSRASSLKVMILENDIDFENEDFRTLSFISGIAVGQSNVLRVENIESRENLKEGDTILINDQKIGTYLYLGNVLSVDEDPTATLQSCSVELPIDYANLKKVFIRKGDSI